MAVTVRDEYVELYRSMVRMRAFDAKIFELYRDGFIRGSAHPYIGMEAIAAGAISAIGPADYITSTHRGHGHCIGRGLAMRGMMAEILGRETGYCRGRGGSMHITALTEGMLGADAIVGGGLALAVGAAYALRLQERGSVVISFFGDGASNEGSFHEALNLAAVLSAPVVFVCENNQWALSTPVTESMKISDISTRGAGYGVPGVNVDGNDVLAMRTAVEEAVTRARSGDGPTLVEAKTYRMTPHSAFASTDTRSVEDQSVWAARDPIKRFKEILVEALDYGDDDFGRIVAEADAEVTDAIEFAKASPQPAAADAFKDVYAPAAWLKEGLLA